MPLLKRTDTRVVGISNTVIPEIYAWLKYCESAKFKGFNKNAILLIRKQGIPVHDHYKMFKNRNYNNTLQKRLKVRINKIPH